MTFIGSYSPEYFRWPIVVVGTLKCVRAQRDGKCLAAQREHLRSCSWKIYAWKSTMERDSLIVQKQQTVLNSLCGSTGMLCRLLLQKPWILTQSIKRIKWVTEEETKQLVDEFTAQTTSPGVCKITWNPDWQLSSPRLWYRAEGGEGERDGRERRASERGAGTPEAELQVPPSLPPSSRTKPDQ